jgi:HTH-type transcriptional regulator/antitoxin HigA
MKIEIKSKKEYHEMMVEIYNLMNKGESKLTKLETKKLSKMAIAAEQYEEYIQSNHLKST